MASAFHREYLIQLPLPLAQLYNRAHNAKDPRNRHDNAYYLFEALVKLMAAPLVAAYLQEMRHGGKRVDVIDWRLQQLALPSLGQWVGIVREVAKHFGTRSATTGHPLAHLWGQLTRPHRDTPGLVGLYQRIKHGADGARAGDRSCSILAVLEALVPYRNGVFGHGAVRFASFYAQDMGPLLFPALNEILADAMLAPIGPSGSRLIYLHEVRAISEEAMEISFRELVGCQGEWGAPLVVGREEAKDLIPHCVAVLWPGQRLPLRLDPLLRYRETDLDAEVLFLNRDHDARQVEYLSYTTGCTERDAAMERAMARLLSLITAQPITEERLAELETESLTATPPEETVSEPPPAPVVQLGDYEILAEIGRGGMGVVYLARQLSLGRLVALKMLPDTLVRDTVAPTRFQREMLALASCDHPNVMKVLTTGTMPDGRLYYTMEYVPGADLEQIWSELAGQAGTAPAARLGSTTFARAVHTASGKQRQAAASRYQSGTHSGAASPSGLSMLPAMEAQDTTSAVDRRIPRLPVPPLPPLPSVTEDPGSYVRCIVTLMRDVALALQAVHDQGITHRDVKPVNLMLTPDGSRVVLMDFGLAKGQDPTLAASRQGGLLGILRYAAPEQLAAANISVGPAADVRGLGVTMWELLTRHRLFEGAKDEKQLAMMIHEADVPRLRAMDPSLDRDLDAIVARATERRISERIETAEQLAEYLQRYLDGEPLPFLHQSIPEKCWRWVQRHRKAVAVGCAGVMLLGAAAAGVWYWDAYQRELVEYSTQVITRWGLPEGVGRLSAEQVRQRNASLALRKHGRRGPVHEIRLVNSRGVYPPVSFHTGFPDLSSLNPLSQETVDGVSEAFATVRAVFERDARGQILNQSAYNRAGRRIYTLHYVHPNTAEYKDEGITRVMRESGIALLKFVRPESGPEAGLVQEVRYFDSAGRPQPNRNGAYGLRHIFDARGLPVKEIVLGADGQPAATKGGRATSTITYDTLANPTQITNFGRDGQALLNKYGFAGVKFAYDPSGNLQGLAFVGTDGQLVPARHMGAAGRRFRYDARGNVVEGTFFDQHHQLVTGRMGEKATVSAFARQTVEWDERGRSTETYFGPDGKPIVIGNRVVKLRGVWDARGYLVETSFFDEVERPIRNNHGCAKLRSTHDAQGSLVAQTCLDERDAPIRSTEGFAHVKWVRNDRGNAIETLSFGPTDQPALYDERYVKVRRKYNPQGKQVEKAFFDATDQPVSNKEGYAKVTYTYDMQGNLTEVAFFDAQHQPTLRQGNYAKLLNTYDARDQLIEQTTYDQQRQPTRSEDGYVTARFAYDPRGYRIETAYFDEDNRPTLLTDGYTKILAQYNDKGQRVEEAFVGLDGAYIPHKEGSAKVRWTYNERGKVARKEFFDPQDHLVQIIYGYATKRYTYDDLGRETTPLFFDVHGAPVHTRVVLEKVEPDRAGAQRGLQVGDILVSYDGEDIRDARTFFNELELLKGERHRELRILRQDQEVVLTVPPGRLTGLTLVDSTPPTLTKAGP